MKIGKQSKVEGFVIGVVKLIWGFILSGAKQTHRINTFQKADLAFSIGTSMRTFVGPCSLYLAATTRGLLLCPCGLLVNSSLLLMAFHKPLWKTEYNNVDACLLYYDTIV